MAIDGNGLYFFHEGGQRINMRTARGEWQQAVAACPVARTTDLKQFRNPSYLYALLTDSRIRGADW